MVRKVTALLSMLVLIVALSSTAQAYTVYDGTISSTYIQYFRDIISGTSLNDNYVVFRSGQNEYIMLVGKIENDGKVFTLSDTGTEYKFYTENIGQYNSVQKYSVKEINSGSVDVGDNIIYSDMGQYPELLERGDKYEILTLYLLVIIVCSIVISRIFFYRKR